MECRLDFRSKVDFPAVVVLCGSFDPWFVYKVPGPVKLVGGSGNSGGSGYFGWTTAFLFWAHQHGLRSAFY